MLSRTGAAPAGAELKAGSNGSRGSRAVARKRGKRWKEAVRARKESSWQSSTANDRIPTYNSAADPLCPLAMARKFNRVEKLRAEAEYAEAGSPSPGSTPKRKGMGVGHLPPMLRTSQSMSAIASSGLNKSAASAATFGTALDRAAGPGFRGEAPVGKTPDLRSSSIPLPSIVYVFPVPVCP